MNFELLAVPAVILLVITSLGLLVSHDWRWSIGLLTIQYVGVFLLVSVSWPIQMAASVLVAGWISGAVLAMALVSIPQAQSSEIAVSNLSDYSITAVGSPETTTLTGVLFRLFGAGVVSLVIISISPNVIEWIPRLGFEQVAGSLVLIGFGLLHLGLTSQPFRVILGLLTVLSGFEIIYAAVEISALVAGLLAGVTLGLALIGAYLLVVQSIEEE